jgi:hypothetical protein
MSDYELFEHFVDIARMEVEDLGEEPTIEEVLESIPGDAAQGDEPLAATEPQAAGGDKE